MQTSKTQSTNYTPNPAVGSAATQNLNYVQNLQNTGFQPYQGNQVASFSPQQSSSFGLGNSIAGGVSPYAPQAGGLAYNYATAGPQSVSADPISAHMAPYMNQYVQQALAPQLEAQNQQFAGQNKGFDSGATMAGAYGNDAQAAIGRANLTNQQDISRMGLLGQAYNSAFNTAIGAGAQDVSNNLGAQTTNASLREQALGREAAGANQLYGMGTGATNLQNTLGGQQTAQSQAGLNAAYNQWLMSQQYPFQTAQLLNQTTSAGAQAMPASNTQTTQQPNNSGWGLLGTVAGAALAPFTGGLSMAIPAAMGAAGGMFGGGGGGAGAGTANDGTAGFADGGTIQAGQPAMVGERGPELAVPVGGSSDNPMSTLMHSLFQAAPQAAAPQMSPQQMPQQMPPPQQGQPQMMDPQVIRQQFIERARQEAALSQMMQSNPNLMRMIGAKDTARPMPPVPHFVGQQGPEMVRPGQPMNIIPNEMLNQMQMGQ